MRIVIDIECDAYNNPTKIWLIVCKNIDTNEYHIFRCEDDEQAKENFLKFAESVDLWIGHHFLGFDWPCLSKLLNLQCDNVSTHCIDTLIISKLVNYSREGGHSIEQYGEEFGLPKGKNHYLEFFKKWSQPLEDYCIRDVDICHRIYLKYLPIISDPTWASSIELEHSFQLIVNELHDGGFHFNKSSATVLLAKVEKQLTELDKKILEAFPPREVLIREFTPKLTKFGTISRTSVPRVLHHEIHKYEDGKTYKHTRLEPFNPSSHKQLIEVLNEAKWKPEDKTQTHIDVEREIQRNKKPSEEERHRLRQLMVSGWKINENNLGTLPDGAPEGARLLAKRILLESRRRTLTEWLGLVQEDNRIHGRFYGIGAWTHRMAHQQPNTANIPTPVKLLGKEMRELWCAPKNRVLVGVDAEGIQLRVFAHYIDDKEFTDALVNGRKETKTDPHSLNQRILGSVCKSRQDAKRFVYALLLGGGLGKLAQILDCPVPETRKALDRLLERYTGFAYLKRTVIPKDARRGYFIGLDGRKVPLPGSTESERTHLCMSGYLQNGEAIIIKRAAIIADTNLEPEKRLGQWMFVDIVHDELQSETRNSMDFALRVAQIKADAIKEAGEIYKLKCPMAGSYWNEDNKDYTIGTNWYKTH